MFRHCTPVVVALMVGVVAAPVSSQTFSTPLPPGPGTVALPLPAGPLAAPVLMPLCAPTAAPVGRYQCGGAADALTTPPACGPKLTLSGELLFWFAQASTLPPLVTVAPAGVPVPPGGTLAQPATDVPFGGTRADTGGRAGGRVGVGYALTPTSGLDARFFFLGDRTDRFAGVSVPGGPTLARPLVVPQTAVAVQQVAAATTTRLLGWDADFRGAILRQGNTWLDLLVGYRYLHLGDRVDVWHAAGGAVVGDSVRSRNHFHGPQLGLDFRCPLAAGFSLDALLKVGLGVTVARADQDGSTRTAAGGVPVGLLVGPANTAHDTETFFGAVPEAGLGVGYECVENLRLSVGYTLLVWSQVRRAADQLDLATGPGRPAFRDRTSDYWAQGVRFGLEWRY